MGNSFAWFCFVKLALRSNPLYNIIHLASSVSDYLLSNQTWLYTQLVRVVEFDNQQVVQHLIISTMRITNLQIHLMLKYLKTVKG